MTERLVVTRACMIMQGLGRLTVMLIVRTFWQVTKYSVVPLNATRSCSG